MITPFTPFNSHLGLLLYNHSFLRPRGLNSIARTDAMGAHGRISPRRSTTDHGYIFDLEFWNSKNEPNSIEIETPIYIYIARVEMRRFQCRIAYTSLVNGAHSPEAVASTEPSPYMSAAGFRLTWLELTTVYRAMLMPMPGQDCRTFEMRYWCDS